MTIIEQGRIRILQQDLTLALNSLERAKEKDFDKATMEMFEERVTDLTAELEATNGDMVEMVYRMDAIGEIIDDRTEKIGEETIAELVSDRETFINILDISHSNEQLEGFLKEIHDGTGIIKKIYRP